MQTVGERAEELGLKVYDTALPQDWVDDVYRLTGTYPVGLFVWCYDEARMMGKPVALTPEAEELLVMFDTLVQRLRNA